MLKAQPVRDYPESDKMPVNILSMVETTVELSSAEVALPGSYKGWDAEEKTLLSR